MRICKSDINRGHSLTHPLTDSLTDSKSVRVQPCNLGAMRTSNGRKMCNESPSITQKALLLMFERNMCLQRGPKTVGGVRLSQEGSELQTNWLG